MKDSPVEFIALHFVRQLREQPDHAALMFRSDETWRSISWRELASDVCNAIDFFTEQAILPGDRIVQVASNCYRWVVIDLACQFARAVHVPVNSKRGAKQIDEIVAHCEPNLVIDEGIEAGTNKEKAADVPLKRLSDLANAIKADELMSILYTSGTTGEPKGVMLSHRNFAVNVRSLLQVSSVRADETRLCFLSLSHVFARTNDLYASIAGGCTLAIADSAQMMFRDLSEIQPTFFNGVPYLFEKCFSELQRRKNDSDSVSLRELLGGRIEAVNCGGAAIDSEIEDYFWDHGLPMITGYGLTETSPVVTASSINDHQRRAVGKPLPDVSVKIAGDGEVLVSGDNVSNGYYRAPELTAATIRDGWFHTGDLGHFEDDSSGNGGFLHIEGRKKELIVTSTGRNILPQLIEAKIDSHPAVARSCVVGEKIPFPVAIVALQDGANSMDLATIEKELRQRVADLSSFEQPGAYLFADEPFSIANEMITEKGTLRRSKIQTRYDESINELIRSDRVAQPDN